MHANAKQAATDTHCAHAHPCTCQNANAPTHLNSAFLPSISTPLASHTHPPSSLFSLRSDSLSSVSPRTQLFVQGPLGVKFTPALFVPPRPFHQFPASTLSSLPPPSSTFTHSRSSLIAGRLQIAATYTCTTFVIEPDSKSFILRESCSVSTLSRQRWIACPSSPDIGHGRAPTLYIFRSVSAPSVSPPPCRHPTVAAVTTITTAAIMGLFPRTSSTSL